MIATNKVYSIMNTERDIVEGDKVHSPIFGIGTVTIREEFENEPKFYPGEIYATGRVGVVFDNHTLWANPAYFWPSYLTICKDAVTLIP